MRKINEIDDVMNFQSTKSIFDYRCFTSYPFKFTTMNEDNSIHTFRGHSVFKTLIRCRYSPNYTNNRYIYTGSLCGEVFIYDTLTG